MNKIKTYKSFNEDFETNKETIQNKLLQLKECFLDLQDFGLEFNMELEEFKEFDRIILEIKKPDKYDEDELYDIIGNGDLNWSDLYKEMTFDMNNEIINIIKFANSYCKEIGIRPGEITYYAYEKNTAIYYQESELISFDNINELSRKYHEYGKVDRISIIYVIDNINESSNKINRVNNYLKTNEEINWHDIAPFGYYAIGALITKIGLNLYSNKKKMDRYKNMISKDSDTYTNSRWKVEENGDIISIKRISVNPNEETESFVVNKSTRDLEYKSSIYPLKVKISKEQLKDLLEGISFTKEVTESIDDCFYELKDEGYNVYLRSIDFSKKTFVINIYKEDRKLLNIIKISTLLNDILHRITNQYEVEVDKSFTPGRAYEKIIYLTEYNNGVVKLSSSRYLKTGDIYDLNIDFQGNRYKYKYRYNLCDGFYMNSLTIPFIKK
jgi:hypothetical protein